MTDVADVEVAPRVVVANFLDLPERAATPRERGITHVLDKGLPLATLESLLCLAGEHIDVIKLGWGTSYVSAGVAAKVAACHRAGVRVSTGGTLLEIAAAQGRVTRFLAWAAGLGVDTVEVSDGSLPMSRATKLRLIEEVARDFRVLAEVGSKDRNAVVIPAEWAEQAAEDLDAGASMVIAEGRESGTVGLYTGEGCPRAEVVEALVAAVSAPRLIFEAPQRTQQTWFVRRLGVDVNLGNISTDDVIGVETLRRGLRADTVALAIPT